MQVLRRAPIESRPLVHATLPTPQPGPGEVCVKVEACGVCGTDINVAQGDLAEGKLPIVPGHQVVGKVDSYGLNVRGLELGMRVGVPWLRHTCGGCEYCRGGKENLCASARFTGYHADGGFAEYVVAPVRYVYKVPERMEAEKIAPLLCSGIIGYRALVQSGVKPGQTLALFGYGSSAHIAHQVAQHLGVRVVVATRGVAHQQLARDLGAEWVGEANEPLSPQVHAAIIFAPDGSLVPTALRSVKPGGTVACAGIHMSELPKMPYRDLFEERTLKSVTANTRQDGLKLFELAARASLAVHTMPFRLGEANEALIEIKAGRVKGTAVLVM